jgi:hypothetical protein
MKRILRKFLLLWTSIVTLTGFSKKREELPINDAILLPERNNKMIVEDFEMAAYHNQA